jgi:glutamate decarboxylase
MTLTSASESPAREAAIAPIFTSERDNIPKLRLAEAEMPPDVAYQIIHDELMLDGNARMNLATFVSTWMEPQAEKLMAECLDKNMIDKDEYPQTAALEVRCVRDPEPPLACARSSARDRMLDDRLERGRDARRSGAQAALAEAS